MRRQRDLGRRVVVEDRSTLEEPVVSPFDGAEVEPPRPVGSFGVAAGTEYSVEEYDPFSSVSDGIDRATPLPDNAEVDPYFVPGLVAKCRQLEADLNLRHRNVLDLTARIRELEALLPVGGADQVQTLSRVIDNLQAERGQLQEIIRTKNQEIDGYKDRIDGLRREATSLRRTADAYKEKKETLEAEKTTFQSQLDMKTRSMQHLDGKYRAEQAKVAELTHRVSSTSKVAADAALGKVDTAPYIDQLRKNVYLMEEIRANVNGPLRFENLETLEQREHRKEQEERLDLAITATRALIGMEGASNRTVENAQMKKEQARREAEAEVAKKKGAAGNRTSRGGTDTPRSSVYR